MLYPLRLAFQGERANALYISIVGTSPTTPRLELCGVMRNSSIVDELALVKSPPFLLHVKGQLRRRKRRRRRTTVYGGGRSE